MKTLIVTLVFILTVVSTFAQANEAPKRMKYVTQAPDGSVAMTIYDDSRDANMKLESANTFYKYQILDPATSEPVYTARNTGKICMIDKSRIPEGTYDIRLYTNKFVITSSIKVSAPARLASQVNSIAMND